MAREILADMAANVWRVLVSEGDAVAAGDTIVILESMKMEIPIASGVDGTVVSLQVDEGTAIQEGDVIAVIE